MKVVQYFTAKGSNFYEDAEFVQNPIYPSEHLNGVTDFYRSNKIVNSNFQGFGIAITGSSCYQLSKMTSPERNTLLQNIYGKQGLALSIGRLSIGSSDYSPEVYSYDEVEGDTDLKYFSVKRDEAYIIPMIQEILKINPNLYLFASPWSPPAWMKTGGSLGGGYMRREFIQCYAEYIIRFIKEYAQYGIKISALTPQNEPETAQDGKMPACIWHPDIEAEFVIALKEKLKSNNLDVKVWLHDHCFSMWKRVNWMLHEHKDLENACDGIAFHYYDGRIEDTLPLSKNYPHLPMHFTEAGPRLYDHYDSDWCKWGIMISKALNMGYKSFTGWNLALDQFGGPNVGPFFCGGLVTRNSLTGEITHSGQYKAFSHFAKFIKQNATVYHVNQESAPLYMADFSVSNQVIPVQVSCIENEDGSVCYFLVNGNIQKKQIQIFENNQWYYVELLPNTLSTVIFEQEKN